MGRKIYLSGPIQFVEKNDAKTWREYVRKEYDYNRYYDPVKANHNPEDELYEMIFEELRQLILSDFILVKYTNGEETWGTPIEVHHAYINQIPVIVWDEDDVYNNNPEQFPNFLEGFSDFIHPLLEKCLRRGNVLSR